VLFLNLYTPFLNSTKLKHKVPHKLFA
jgi:hypothetical protein